MLTFFTGDDAGGTNASQPRPRAVRPTPTDRAPHSGTCPESPANPDPCRPVMRSIILKAALLALYSMAPPAIAAPCVTPGNWLEPGRGETESGGLLARMSRQSVVLVGETHDVGAHHDWQVDTLASPARTAPAHGHRAGNAAAQRTTRARRVGARRDQRTGAVRTHRLEARVGHAARDLRRHLPLRPRQAGPAACAEHRPQGGARSVAARSCRGAAGQP
jgi:hypothetical protein